MILPPKAGLGFRRPKALPRGFEPVPQRGPDQAGVGIENSHLPADPREIAQDARVVQDDAAGAAFDKAKQGTRLRPPRSGIRSVMIWTVPNLRSA